MEVMMGSIFFGVSTPVNFCCCRYQCPLSVSIPAKFFNWDENRRTYIVPIPFLKERFGVPCFVWGSFPPAQSAVQSLSCIAKKAAVEIQRLKFMKNKAFS